MPCLCASAYWVKRLLLMTIRVACWQDSSFAEDVTQVQLQNTLSPKPKKGSPAAETNQERPKSFMAACICPFHFTSAGAVSKPANSLSFPSHNACRLAATPCHMGVMCFLVFMWERMAGCKRVVGSTLPQDALYELVMYLETAYRITYTYPADSYGTK